jgi:hypothetical protein
MTRVWILFGGRVPFVPRKIRSVDVGSDIEGHEQSKSHYLSIEDSYVHKIMGGEKIDDNSGRNETVLLH